MLTQKEMGDMSAKQIIERLEQDYKDDKDALEEIKRAKQNIKYIESQKDYEGQSPWQHAVSLAGMLDLWG